jgi:hypothetical protein
MLDMVKALSSCPQLPFGQQNPIPHFAQACLNRGFPPDNSNVFVLFSHAHHRRTHLPTHPQRSPDAEWTLQRCIVTSEERMLGLFSKRVAYGGVPAVTSFTSLPGLASLTPREKSQRDTVPGDQVWSGIALEPSGQCYVCWDGGHLVRGVAGLEVSRLAGRFGVLSSLRTAVWDVLREVGAPLRHDTSITSGSGLGATSVGAELRASAIADVRRVPSTAEATSWTQETGE